MNITKKTFIISDFGICKNTWGLRSITLNTRAVFVMISTLIMTAFKKIVVIGAGTMGSGIAAHLANSKRDVVDRKSTRLNSSH